MIRLKLVLPLLAILVVAASCTKAERISNRMKAKKGEWIVAEYAKQGNFYGEESSESYTDAGEIVFKENAYILTLNIKGETYTSSGTWQASSGHVTLVDENYPVEYAIISSSRKEMTLQHTESFYYNDISEQETTTIRLRR